ncbi:hypothetical protein [Sphingorhabdus sp. M41]|uniref:hypothetical protein n=1 Tax=Sphingorhabdus sp. M41 TaxID=1806885 RepID=UPI0012E81DDA|nr:hypothetical protein [Sphingorhabdus sp. M41]
MNSEQRQQIRLILADALLRAEKDIREKVRHLHTDHAAKGCLNSGATLKRHVEIFDTVGQSYVSSTLDAIADVSMEMEAFAIYEEGHMQLSTMMRRNLKDDNIYGVCTTGNPNSAVANAINLQFLSVEGQLKRLKDLRRYSFTRPEPIDMASFGLSEKRSALMPKNEVTKNKGGRPAAEHWDEMWATIATLLYEGDLNPKRQADIEKAMMDWLESNGHSAADSTVRKRARLLWQRLEVAEN